jgi:hypothetical protein
MRSAPMAASLLAAALLTAACGSSGTHTQTPGPTSPTGDLSTTPTSVSSSTAPTTRPRTPPSTKPIPTPTVTPPAQPAVDAYIAGNALSIKLYSDPKHANTALLGKYEAGQALATDIAALKAMASAGTAYRGDPPQSHIKVVAVSATMVALSDCGLQSAANPYVEYYVETGKPVPTRHLPAPPPYLKALSLQLINGNWKLTNIAVDGSKTCKP